MNVKYILIVIILYFIYKRYNTTKKKKKVKFKKNIKLDNKNNVLSISYNIPMTDCYQVKCPDSFANDIDCWRCY